jgi:hypothetical protein
VKVVTPAEAEGVNCCGWELDSMAEVGESVTVPTVTEALAVTEESAALAAVTV